MPTTRPEESDKSGGMHFGDVGGNVTQNAGGDIVGRDKIEITQISADVVTQYSLVTASPYRGLERFEHGDTELFFGRDQLIESLLAKVSTSNILLVVGASGSGKSSVVRAGLLSRLKAPPGSRYRSFTLVPDANPFESLRNALQAGGFSQAQTRELLDAQPDTPIRLIHALQGEGEKWFIFVDQFEEIFTISDAQLCSNFISALVRIAQDSASLKLVLAMRGDFFDRFGPFPEFSKLIEENIAVVNDMHADELRLAIEQPAARHGVIFEQEQGLVEEIIKDVQDQAGSLPLLQYTLDLLWKKEYENDRLVGRHLRAQTYRELGGVRGTLQKRADKIYASFGDNAESKPASAKQEIVRQIFLRLVDIAGEGSEDAVWHPVRRRAAMAVFSTAQEQDLLQELIKEKLLVSKGTKAATEIEHETSFKFKDTEATVEVAHEALFTSWERLKKWIEGAKQVIFVKNRLADDARRWHSRGQEDKDGAKEELLSGSRLDQALDIRKRGDFGTVVGGLSKIETEFLDASAAHRDRREQEEQERRQRELAQAQKLAEAERKRAEDAIAAAKKIGEVASRGNVSLARNSEQSGKNAQALAQLAHALWLNPENREASGFTVAMLTQLNWHVPLRGSMRHHAPVRSAQFSPDGQRVATASGLTAQLWDAASGQPVGEPMKHDKEVNSARFSPDGQQVVTASKDQTVRLWDAANGKSIGERMKHDSVVNSAQFSPDGQRIVTASELTMQPWDPWGHASPKPIGKLEGTAQLWDATSGQPIGEPMKHGGDVNSAQFSPDGQRVVTASELTAQLWDAATGKPIGEPMVHKGSVNSAEFSPDGQRVVTTSGDRTARLWDAVSGKPIGEPRKHKDWVVSAQFSPDGQRLVTASWDNTARLWDADSDKPIGEPMKHDAPVRSAQFSPDGQRVVTTSRLTAWLWDAASGKAIGQLMKHGAEVNSAQFSPDGQQVVTASWLTARVWNVASGKAIGEPMKHDAPVRSAQFSPDGQRVVTASGLTAQLWDAASGKAIGELMKHGAEVNSAQFSPDGQWVVTASKDQTVRLWDAASGKAIGELMKHDAVVNSAQFSPDGRRVVTASGWTARLWDVASGKAIGEPMQHESIVVSAQFSPDGRRVVTASWDNTARLWDAASAKPISGSMGHKGEGRLNSAQFSPDGQRVVTASRDETARLWDVAIMTDEDKTDDILFLAELAEATGGVTLETVGQVENFKLLTPEEVRASLEKIAAKFLGPSSRLTPLQQFLKWYISDRRSRAISPFSPVTVPEWLENRIEEGTVEGLRAALQVDPTNARVTAHLGRRLADLVSLLCMDPDGPRRARGEADFLTSRAVRLAPDNDEVKKLRDEVVKLLELKTN
jgi:WD40 repeat protein